MTTKKPPATILHITLDNDSSGSLLIERGELAHLSTFSYEGMQDIMNAIQNSAVMLMALEKEPEKAEEPEKA